MALVAWRRSRVVGGIVWVLLGVGLLAFSTRELLAGMRPNSQMFEASLGAFCLLTGIAVVKFWKVGRWFAGLGGILVGLYALALVLLGSEDVGGLAVSLPVGFLLLAFSLWNVVAATAGHAKAA